MFRNRLEEVYDRVIKIADRSSIIVDGGCGEKGTTGGIFKDYNYIGFDLNIRNASFVGDITKIAIKSEIVDVFLACEILEHLEIVELNNTFKEIRRVLKQGGYFIFTFPVDWKTNKGKHKTHLKPKYVCDEFDDYKLIEKTIVYKNQKAKDMNSSNHLVMMKK